MTPRSPRNHRIRRCVAGAVALLALTMPTLSTSSGASTHPRDTLHLSTPTALRVIGTNLWVANAGANSLSELTSTGTLVRTVSGAKYHFSTPRALAAVGTTLIVVNTSPSLTEINGVTGALVRVITGTSYHLNRPVAALTIGTNLFVANEGNSTIAEIDATTGRLVRILTNAPKGPLRFDGPVALASTSTSTTLWVANAANSSVTVVKIATGAVTSVLSSPTYDFSGLAGLAVNGADVWATNSATDSVTEFNATTGAFVQNITNSSLNANYGFNAPATVISWQGFVYVVSPPGTSPMVTQLQATTGDANWMMCNTNYAFNFLGPASLAILQGNLWVANAANNTLTEMDATTGVLIQDVS